jgi:hypothetical protein
VRSRETLIALALGGLAWFFTRELVVGLLVGGAAFGLVRMQSLQRRRASSPFPLPTNLQRPERATGMHVVCKRVTSERQEWVSTKTGRIYEVLSHSGPPGAKPGDEGEVILGPVSYRIAARTHEKTETSG